MVVVAFAVIGVPAMPSSSEVTIPITALEGHPPPAGFYVSSTITSECRVGLPSILGRVLPLQANALAFGKREVNAGLFK